MRASIYNNYLVIDNMHTLLFNSLSQRFLLFKNRIVDSELALLNVSRNSGMQFHDKLKEGGMIVEEDVDEVDIVRKLITETDYDTKSFMLIVNPTLDCNFNCWYCYERKIADSRMSPDILESVKKLVDKIFRENDSLENFYLSFFGGEPLLHFDDVVAPLIDYISHAARCMDVNLSVNFTSNGFLITRSMIEKLRRLKTSFQITLDGGRQMHDKTRFSKGGSGSYDGIIRNVKRLLANGINVILRINFTQKNIDSVWHIVYDIAEIDTLHKKYLNVDLQRVWQDRKHEYDDTEETADKIRASLREKGFTVSTNNLFQDVKSSCYGDKKNTMLVNFNGDVFGCTARDFTLENRIGFLCEDGSIKLEEEKYELRMKAKFSQRVCHTCRIAPLCGGGCRQQAVEHYGMNECYYEYSDEFINKKILSLFELQYLCDRTEA